MPNTEAACQEQFLVVQYKKQKQEGTFHCTHLGTETSSEAFPSTVIVIAVLLTHHRVGVLLVGTCLDSPLSELSKSFVAC